VATFDQLNDTQRTVLELLLAERKSYEYLAGRLDKTEDEVRDIARGALVELTPVTSFEVEEEWLAPLSDYLLGADSRAVVGHMRRSEAARTWARSVLDSLAGLYDGNMPAVPEPGKPPSPRSIPSRGRLIGASSLFAGALLAAVLVWPFGLLIGGGDDSGAKRTATTAKVATGKKTQGQAVIARQGGKDRLVIGAVGLKPSTTKQPYEVRLYNSSSDSRSLGYAAANTQGQLQGGATLPSGFNHYRYIDVSLGSSSVLRGAIQSLKKPVTQGSGKNRATVTASFRLQPVSSSAG
jgi:hypothetical protein